MSEREKKILAAFIILCILLPFGMVRSPIEIFSRVAPLWLSYYGTVWFWAYWGKPLWESFLACYGISSLGIIVFYFGINVPGVLLSWLKKLAKMGKPPEKPAEKKIKKNPKMAKWLERGSAVLIIAFLILPLPFSDPAATAAMKLKKIKYGLWYLLGFNVPHVLLIVWAAYKGIVFFPNVIEFLTSVIEFLKRLFM